jgi:5-methylcytosine-specific restriction endonuclease McrA
MKSDLCFQDELEMNASVLQRPTLVLNRNWQPVNVATVARALVLLWNEAARIVDVADYETFSWNDWSQLRPRDGDAFVQAISVRLRVPEVIALTEYDRLPASAATFSRRNIFKRDRYVCQYCGGQPETGELTIDHIVPRAQGGVSSWTNCVLACVTCNKRKSDRTPREAGMQLRKQPIRPMWKPVYADHHVRLESWSKFVSEVYWNVELEK